MRDWLGVAAAAALIVVLVVLPVGVVLLGASSGFWLDVWSGVSLSPLLLFLSASTFLPSARQRRAARAPNAPVRLPLRIALTVVGVVLVVATNAIALSAGEVAATIAGDLVAAGYGYVALVVLPRGRSTTG